MPKELVYNISKCAVCTTIYGNVIFTFDLQKFWNIVDNTLSSNISSNFMATL